MLSGDPKKPRRSFQPIQKTSQDDMWYSTLPIDVMWGIYARQSTQAQVLKNFESTEMQTDDLMAYLLERGVKDGSWQLFDADLGLSGTLPIDKRTGLQELVEWIQEAVLDERLGLRTQIAQQIRAALVEDENADVDQMKAYLEPQFAKDFERLQGRSQKLDKRELELKAKLPEQTEDKRTPVSHKSRVIDGCNSLDKAYRLLGASNMAGRNALHL